MLINSEEYRAMFEVEDNLWWYKILHGKVISEINSFANGNKQIKILDAGCGTGGLLLKLQDAGYQNIQGFDFNDDAVAFSKSRGLNVQKLDITHLQGVFEKESFDVIVSDDVLYQFEDDVIEKTISSIVDILKHNGIFITNNNAFEIFRGTHDIAVGSKKRFILKDFKAYLSNAKDVSILKHHYWSLLLSPLILVVRLVQKLKLKLHLVDLQNIKSDVEMPSEFMNNLFYNICITESKILKKSPFGSSLFLVIKKEK
ncbi:bifunctional 2-polyprenyl-6-hydroxyphenol methylase/3-demethylubiquinol 3-O-methyltransferase UbiG [Lacihabitans sp. CS3-21]|uniref:class I SAM-dependent methyltransferase n=1 Tax=Lacihabitans sp. CS3-21 TaxID=2487332 RepID=UPI0020CD09F6|nr:class I SAM-dependent methyltransferase [Lacihabitans sp. CS3-21]MCP9749270.1 class I SAM-dependent methyltransferase [Lacihabitans sp. CS3-21]